MSRDQARLTHLLARLQSVYGEQDADVIRLREQVRRLAMAEADTASPLLYKNAPLFGDRKSRLIKTSTASDQQCL